MILWHYFLWDFSAIFTLMAFEHEPVIILGAVKRWIASTLYQVCVHLWSQNAGKGILEAHILKLFLGEHDPGSPFGAHGRGYATPKTSLFLVDRVGISGYNNLLSKIW